LLRRNGDGLASRRARTRTRSHPLSAERGGWRDRVGGSGRAGHRI